MASRKTAGSGGRRRSTTGEQPPSGPSELILYTTPDRQTRIEVRLEDETVWLSQRQIAELFQKSVKTINEHIGNVYDEGELTPGPTIRKSRIVQTEGEREVSREVEHYNLDVIISVGYRVKSHRGTQFRIWATQRLREYLVKGFALDDERLKEIRTLPGGRDYFDELLYTRSEAAQDQKCDPLARWPAVLQGATPSERCRFKSCPRNQFNRSKPSGTVGFSFGASNWSNRVQLRKTGPNYPAAPDFLRIQSASRNRLQDRRRR